MAKLNSDWMIELNLKEILEKEYEKYLKENNLPDTVENAKEFILSFLTKKS